MGASEDEGNQDEYPKHTILLGDFWISKYPVTQSLYELIFENNPSTFKHHYDCPVETVSWNDAMEFCDVFSKKHNINVRLPYEAEWEYACRAGSTTNYYWGNEDELSIVNEYVWFGKNAGGKTQPVGIKKPNNWGIHDMNGNVWEWCMDWYDENYYSSGQKINPHGPDTGTYKVLRGGSWSTSICVRSVFRTWNSLVSRDSKEGFRMVISV